MSLPVWPVSVPYDVMVDGWSMEQPYLAPIGTEMDGGNKRLRRRPGDDVAIIAYQLKPLSAATFDTLDSFIRSDLGNGTARFTMTLWTGRSYESKTVQIEDIKIASPIPGKVNVALKLRVFGI